MKNLTFYLAILFSCNLFAQNNSIKIPGTFNNQINIDSLVLNPSIKMDTTYKLINMTIEIYRNRALCTFTQKELDLQQNVLTIIRQLTKGNRVLFHFKIYNEGIKKTLIQYYTVK